MRLIAILLLALSAGLALAQDDLVPLPVPAGSVEFTGTWSYMTFDHQNSGPCPPGKPMSGTLSIAGTSDAATVTLLSGAVCSPASMCAFDGEITGNDLVVSTSAIVDDEGGSATSALRVYFYSADAGGAEVSARYVHPEGIECHWSHFMELHRSAEENGE